MKCRGRECPYMTPTSIGPACYYAAIAKKSRGCSVEECTHYLDKPVKASNTMNLKSVNGDYDKYIKEKMSGRKAV